MYQSDKFVPPYDIDQDGYDAEVTEQEAMLREQNLTYDQLLRVAANYKLWGNYVEFLYQDLDQDLKNIELEFERQRINVVTNVIKIRNAALFKGAELQKTNHARNAALAKIAADPKQKEKSFVYECWQDWQKKPDSYKSKAAFGKDMLNKCEHLTSQKKIEDWCREWEKPNPAG